MIKEKTKQRVWACKSNFGGCGAIWVQRNRNIYNTANRPVKCPQCQKATAIYEITKIIETHS